MMTPVSEYHARGTAVKFGMWQLTVIVDVTRSRVCQNLNWTVLIPPENEARAPQGNAMHAASRTRP